jgi:carbon storage regulator CsrA
MLVLTRKNQESVAIGSADHFQRLLKVTVLEICRGKVKLGFEASSDLVVHRWEIWERIQANGESDSLRENPATPIA